MASWSRRALLRSAGAAGTLAGTLGSQGCTPRGGDVPRPDSGSTPSGRPPNIVYIYSDQHRGPIVGGFGDPIARTPRLDGLMASAVRFPSMFTCSPLCRPARASMMTGRLPHLHGCWNNDTFADPDGPSHVRRIRDEAGYRTALIGKSHLTLVRGHPLEARNVEQMVRWGFEESFELLSQITCATKPNPYSDWLVDNTPQGEPSKAARYAAYVTAWELLGFPPPDDPPYELGTEDHVDLWCGALAADWIRAVPPDERPFYLQVNFPGPHSPYDATREFLSLYHPGDPAFPTPILGPPGEPRSPAVSFLWDERPELHGLTAEQGRALLATYYAKVSLIDRAVGSVLDALEAEGLLEDTWVIYGSDHGDLLGDHELWGKVAMYEGAVRTPLVVRPPGGVAPRASEALIDQLDVTATLLQIAGLEPDGTGRGRLDAWLGGEDPGRDSVISEVAAHPNGTLRTGMLRRERHKLVYDFDGGQPVELYDLEADPEERTNRVLDPSQRVLIAELRDELLDTIEAERNG